MISSYSAIVLSSLKYKDTSLIIKCFTKKHGSQTFIANRVFSSKKRTLNPSYFNVLSQVEIIASHKTNQDIYTIKSVKADQLYSTLHTNIYKSTTGLFLGEVLQEILKSESENQDLYDYLTSSLIWFDLNNFNPNFHISFLLNLTKFIGIYPNLESNNQEGFHNLDLTKLSLLKNFIGIDFDKSNSIRLNADSRHILLNSLLHYFDVHLGSFKKPKSLKVLHDVFK